MQTYRIATRIQRAGELHLDHVPFAEGEEVNVIVMRRRALEKTSKYPLRGRPVRYDDPFKPVAEEDWEALR